MDITLLDYISGTTQATTVNQLLHDRLDLIALLKQKLVLA